MNSDYDPRLEEVFARARQEFDREAFTRLVMSRIDASRRRTLFAWGIAASISVVALVFLAPAVLAALRLMTELLPVSIVEIENDLAEQLLAPVNSIAALIAVVALVVRKVYRRIFG